VANRVVQPLINGHRYSYASIEFIAAGVQFFGVKSIKWGASLKPGVIRGIDSVRVGRTPGEGERTCEVVMYLREANALRATIGQSYGRRPFDIVVQYAEPYDPDKTRNIEGVTTVAIKGCRITEEETANEEGPDATTVTFSIDPHDIITNGLSIDFATAALPDGRAA
jgi:hypothetical protein